MTELFRDDQADEDIDRWFLGEDCARWLHSKLCSVEGIASGIEPLEEDWGGWTFGVRVEGVRFTINIWPGRSLRKTWIVGIEPRPGMRGIFTKKRTGLAKARLCDAIASILVSTPEIIGRRWLIKHPLS